MSDTKPSNAKVTSSTHAKRPNLPMEHVATHPAKRRRQRPAKAKKPIEPTVVVKVTDELGTLVNELSEKYLSSASWEQFVKDVRGPTLLRPDLDRLPHPAGLYLNDLSTKGSPAKSCGEPWTL
jgi:hypothetical protein